MKGEHQDPLSILEGHFGAVERFEVRIPGVEGTYYAKPLSFEESLKLMHAMREQSAAKQARMYAELIVEKVRTHAGDKAFLGDKHFTAEERLVGKVPPTVLSDIIACFEEQINEQAEALAKKSGPPGSAS